MALDNEFIAAMSTKEYEAGEARYREVDYSRALAMSAGLTKSSSQLKRVWDENPDTYITLLKGAIAAYEQNQLVEELLRGAIARLASIIDDDTDSEVIKAAVDIAFLDYE